MAIPTSIRALMRPSAAALEPYDPMFSQVAINLSANENTYGMPAEVAGEVARALGQTATNRYPLPLAPALRTLVARRHDVAPEQVIIGNGGDELSFDLFLAFGGAGATVVNCPPTFSIYRLYAELCECAVIDVPRDPETFAVDELALLAHASEARVTVVTTPNNPTGTAIGLDFIEELCANAAGLVLVDEAYQEFAGTASAVTLLDRCPNLVVLRTLSKAFALAGLRCGYLVADPSIIDELSAIRQIYSVDVLAQATAVAAVKAREELRPVVSDIKAERERLSLRLGNITSLHQWPSEANFILVRIPHASQVRQRLRDEFSILVRDFSYAPGLADCLRITVGTREENDRLVEALTSLEKEEA